MKSLSLRWLFVLAFGVIVLFTVVVGFVSFRSNAQILSEMTTLTDTAAPALVALNRINTLAFRIQAEALSAALLSGEDDDEAESEEAEAEEALEELQGWLDTYDTLAPSPADAEALRTSVEAMVAESLEIAELAEDGAPADEIVEQKEVAEDAEGEYTDILAAILEREQAIFDASQASAVTTTEQTRNIVLGGVTLAVVGSIAVALYLANQIVTPITRLKTDAVRIGQGGQVDDSATFPGNEIGVLADEFNNMATNLLEQRKLAEAASAAKTSLLARVSHELRTPLGAVLGMGGMLAAEEDIKDDHRQLANYIVQYSNELTVLVNQLLEQARWETSGKDATLKLTALVPRDLLQETVTKMAPQGNQKSVELTFTCEDSLPQTVTADENKVRQILNNLVTNALKFTEEGSITLHAYGLPGDKWAIDVTDTGIGIDEAAVSRIFEAFTQVDEGDTREYGGVGLGLSIVKQFADLMGGQVAVKSKTGEGSTFTVTLPVTVKDLKPEGAI